MRSICSSAYTAGCGPESIVVTGTYAAGPQLPDVGHQLRLQHREVHRVESAALADRVGDVVVTVDERDGLQDSQGLRAVVLGGQADRRTGGQKDRQHEPRFSDR